MYLHVATSLYDLAEEICTKHQERLDDFHAKQYWIAVAKGPGSGNQP